MVLADACAARAFPTTDNDFRAYRKNGRQMILLIMPE